MIPCETCETGIQICEKTGHNERCERLNAYVRKDMGLSVPVEFPGWDNYKHPLGNKFTEILKPIADLLQKKNRDYGSSYDLIRNEFGEISFLIRLSDKFNRLKTLAKQPPEVVSESVEDTIKDIIGYCTLELAYRAHEEDSRQTS